MKAEQQAVNSKVPRGGGGGARLDLGKHPRGGAAMEVSPRVEGVNHACTVGKVREDAELELAVVRNDERAARRCAEGLADVVAVLLERRLVLQVGPPAREAARLGVEVQAAVHAAILRAARPDARHNEVL
jgi:hypothetical protein